MTETAWLAEAAEDWVTDAVSSPKKFDSDEVVTRRDERSGRENILQQQQDSIIENTANAEQGNHREKPGNGGPPLQNSWMKVIVHTLQLFLKANYFFKGVYNYVYATYGC